VTTLQLRRTMAETPAFFDLRREQWRKGMRDMCPAAKRDRDGRYAR